MTSAASVNNQAVPLTAVYQGWDGYQRELVTLIAPLTPEQLALPIAPHHVVPCIATTYPSHIVRIALRCFSLFGCRRTMSSGNRLRACSSVG